MKRIVLLKSNISHSGGLEKYTKGLAQAFGEKGCHTIILSTGNNTTPADAAYRITSLGNPNKISLINLLQYNKACENWLKNNPADIVFGLDRNVNQTHYRAGNGVHAEYLEIRKRTDGLFKKLSFVINPLHQAILYCEKTAYENPNLKTLFTNSHMVKAEILKHYKTDPAKIDVVHNGVEWAEMERNFQTKEEERTLLKKQLGLNPDAYQFLFVGHGYRRKGLSILLEALHKLKAFNFQLSVVGKDRERRSFEEIAKKLSLESKVHFFGLRNDIYNFYTAADCLVIPSLYDPFANVTVEALAMGLFVVSSKSNGGSEVLTGENGCIIQDLSSLKSVVEALEIAMHYQKTQEKALKIRESVKYLDFSKQLNLIVEKTLK